MCPKCVEWNKNSKKFKDSKCYQDHELRVTLVSDLKTEDAESIVHICRCCNDNITQEYVNFCRYCSYGLCMTCKDTIHISSKIISKTKCKKNHELRWTVSYNFTSSCNIIYCSDCGKKYLGAGTFSCTSCKYNMCVKCFNKKYI